MPATTTPARFVNVNGHSGTQTVNANQKATNYEAYAENRFWVNSSVALMLGAKAFSSDRDLHRLLAPAEFGQQDV